MYDAQLTLLIKFCTSAVPHAILRQYLAGLSDCLNIALGDKKGAVMNSKLCNASESSMDIIKGSYAVATFRTERKMALIMDIRTSYHKLFAQDVQNVIDAMNADFKNGLIEEDYVEIYGGPISEGSLVAVTLTGFNEGTYCFDDNTTDRFKNVWTDLLARWDFLKEK